MAERHYLVLARDAAAQKRVAVRVREARGVVLIALPSLALIVRLEEQAKDALAASSDVRHCGAIEVSPRPIRRIKVTPDGTRMPA